MATEDYSERNDRLEQAIRDVEAAVRQVKEVIDSKWSLNWVGWLLIIYVILEVPGWVWHSKYRYALVYGVSPQTVTVQDKPHDCEFLAAPLGGKYCHYEPFVSTVRWATSTQGNAIVSYDDGKTWDTYTPAADEKVPQYSTIKEVLVSWEKKEG